MINYEELDPHEEYMANLHAAHSHAHKALDFLYAAENRINRSFWYRAALGRAQNTLIKLLNREYNRKKS